MQTVVELQSDLLEIEAPEVSLIGVKTQLSLPHFAWCVENCLSLRFRYDILREKFIGLNDLKKYKKWNLLGYPIHDYFETYIAFPDISEPSKLMAITRNYEPTLNKYFLPQYKNQDFFVIVYNMDLSEIYGKIDETLCHARFTPLMRTNALLPPHN
ncbi:MAG: hypothetical protein NZ455_13210 [Bacteroidia bacterium]|nr:hypothetical protein [Bacteroidia bacterium]MDW8346994.1 hypothetical protein [Bacteroidia bacterium]